MGLCQTSKPKFKAILFDKDGTLVDFNGTWLALYEKLALEAADGDAAEAERLLAVGGYDRAANAFIAGSELAAGTTETIVRLWISGDAERLAFWKTRMDRAFVEEGPAAAVPVPGLSETLHLLHGEGRRLAVVTNDLEAAARRTIENFGVAHLFSAFLGYDSVKNPKPAADPVHLACRLLGIAPEEALVVGDNLHDLEMAHNSGAGAAIGVLTGTTGRDELASKADAVLPSIADLPQWLASAGR
jgi:phosphoglycolate phosphatase